MITRQELKALASQKFEDAYFVSLFLNVDPKEKLKDNWHLHFKNLAKNALTSIPQPDKLEVGRDIERLEKYLLDRPDGLKRGFTAISCAKKEFWWTYHSAIPFPNELIVHRNPYLKPLMLQFDQYQRYLVVIVGGDEARLFISGMGELESVASVDRPISHTDPTRDGHRGDMGELRAQRHREKEMRVLLKDLATTIDKVKQQEEIKRILLGGTDNARGKLKELLSDWLLDKIVAEFHIEHNASEKEILDRVLPVMKEVEYKFERKALKELFDRIGTGEGGGVLGLSDVLTALQQGNIRKMFVMSHFPLAGMVCAHCHALTPVRERDCPYCNEKLQEAPHIVDLAIQKAIDQGVRIDMIDDSADLIKAGGIGAMLRY
jgi:peptide subunit release factor 1 (eRF1)